MNIIKRSTEKMVIKKYLMTIKGIISHTEETPTRRILFDHLSMNFYRQKG